AVGPQQCCEPRDNGTPIMTGEDRLFGTQQVEQPDHVADHAQQRILVDRLRAFGPAIASQVRRQRVNPTSAKSPSWWRHEYQDSGKPWHNRTSGPAPCSATCMRIPLVMTVRCVASVIVTSALWVALPLASMSDRDTRRGPLPVRGFSRFRMRVR